MIAQEYLTELDKAGNSDTGYESDITLVENAIKDYQQLLNKMIP